MPPRHGTGHLYLAASYDARYGNNDSVSFLEIVADAHSPDTPAGNCRTSDDEWYCLKFASNWSACGCEEQ